jgi:hypothetical protein
MMRRRRERVGEAGGVGEASVGEVGEASVGVVGISVM